MLKPLTIQSGALILAGSMLRLLVALLPTLHSALRSRRDLVAENLALRQQLATLAGRRHPVIRRADRLFWILLRRFWSGWAECLAIVRPDTVVRWDVTITKLHLLQAVRNKQRSSCLSIRSEALRFR